MLLLITFLPGLAIAQWEKVTNLPAGYDNNYWLDVYFLESNPNYGWICGYQGLVLFTNDGGTTWNPSNVDVNAQLESIHFASEKIGYTSGAGMIFKSTDGGATWKDITPDKPASFWGCFFITPDIGLVVGEGCGILTKQNFYRTTNGGISWNIFQGDQYNSGMTDVILYNENGLGYASSSGFIWITNNGGRTWDVFSRSGDNDWQEELANYGNTFLVPYSGECTGGGPGGMRISTDNGNSWSQTFVGVPMFGSFLINELSGWACGWNQSVYYTSDGGKNWINRNCGIDVGVNLDDIWFINDTLGWLVGNGVYKFYPVEIGFVSICAIGDITFCEGDSVTLHADQEFSHYRWSNGDTSRTIVTGEPGFYSVAAWNKKCDTVYSNTIKVTVYPGPEPTIASKGNKFCENDSLYIYIDSEDLEVISWSTGSNSEGIYVNATGTYTITVRDAKGCIGTSTIFVEKVPLPDPVINIVHDNDVCKGDSVLLEVNGSYSSLDWYEHNTSMLVQSGSNKIYVKESGSYYAVVTNELGCLGYSDTVEVIVRIDSNRLVIQTEMDKGPFVIDSVAYPEILCRELTVRNIGGSEYHINDIYVYGNTSFSLPQAQFPIIIPPYASSEITVCYSPSKLETEIDSILIGDNCSPHTAILKAAGKVNHYEAETRCAVPVSMVTSSLYGSYHFLVDNPSPNPSVSIVTIPYTRISTPDYSISEDCLLYNSLGNLIAEGKKEILSQGIIGTQHQENGEFNMDVSGLDQGAYFVVIAAGTDRRTFPLIIKR